MGLPEYSYDVANATRFRCQVWVMFQVGYASGTDASRHITPYWWYSKMEITKEEAEVAAMN